MIYHQSVFKPWPLEDKSVQAIITSPPYWGLRKYDIPDIIIGGDSGCNHEWNISHHLDTRGGKGSTLQGADPNGKANRLNYAEGFCIKCNAWKGQYGLEPTVKLYVEHTLLWVQEALRVLKDDGVFFLNLGDTYGGSWGNFGARKGRQRQRTSKHFERIGALPASFKPPTIRAPSKCKLLIPHRVAIALCDELGLILRNDIVWQKPNSTPESCRDRFSKKFEHIFMFTKQKKYYFNLDMVREPYKQDGRKKATVEYKEGSDIPRTRGMRERWPGKGANPGDIWSIATQPSSFKHYAMWPEKLVERMINCSTYIGATILDPFCGSGTTLAIAKKLQRAGIGIDLGYKDIQKERMGM